MFIANNNSPTPPCPTLKGVRDHIEMYVRPWGGEQAKSNSQKRHGMLCKKGNTQLLSQITHYLRDLVCLPPAPAGHPPAGGRKRPWHLLQGLQPGLWGGVRRNQLPYTKRYTIHNQHVFVYDMKRVRRNRSTENDGSTVSICTVLKVFTGDIVHNYCSHRFP